MKSLFVASWLFFAFSGSLLAAWPEGLPWPYTEVHPEHPLVTTGGAGTVDNPAWIVWTHPDTNVLSEYWCVHEEKYEVTPGVKDFRGYVIWYLEKKSIRPPGMVPVVISFSGAGKKRFWQAFLQPDNTPNGKHDAQTTGYQIREKSLPDGTLESVKDNELNLEVSVDESAPPVAAAQMREDYIKRLH